jgi:cystathionine beta-lyase
MKTKTRCVHSGTSIDRLSGGINTPIHTSSSFRYLDATENIYPRYFNTPNQQAVVRKLCALEEAQDGLLFSSGMAAVSAALLSFLQHGDHVVLQRDIYGGTHHFVTTQLERFGIEFSFASNRTEDIASAFRANTRMVFIESPSNPLLQVTDIRSVAELAASRGVLSIIDNTFATPIHQKPLALGIDIVVHSGTKYLGGHSDLCCGVALASNRLVASMRATAADFGGSLNALTCYLLERSLKTLAVRVAAQSRNAQAIAEFLQSQAAVVRVHYPGLAAHPGHALAREQMKGFGAMLAFELPGKRQADRFLHRLKLVVPALSLGGVETIVCAPAETSHAKISAEERQALGISDGLLRLSVGIEDADDLIADLSRALSAV